MKKMFLLSSVSRLCSLRLRSVQAITALTVMTLLAFSGCFEPEYGPNNPPTVTFDSLGATIQASPTIKMVDWTTKRLLYFPNNPTKTGYIFGGWFTAPNGGGTAFTTDTTVEANITVYAKWNSYAYTVTFDNQSATTPSNPSSKTVTTPATTVDALPTAPTKTGYIFGGWFTAPNVYGLPFNADTTVAANITVYAKWNPCTYTIIFDSQGATVAANPTSKTVTPPATTVGTLPIAPVKTGYIFGGWFTAPNGGGTAFTAGTTVAANITVYAKWNSYTYTVTFDSQGATVPASPTGKTVISPATTVDALPTAPAKTGYTFGGWHTAINGGGTEFIAGTTVNADITVYAYWSANPVYTVTYNSDGGTLVGEQYVTLPATTVDALPTAPTKTGYTFGGWYTAINGGGTAFTAGTTVNADITVYAKWNSYTYMVSFDSQGATVPASPNFITISSPLTTVGTLPMAPTKTGINFGGWYTAINGGGTEFTAGTTVNANITVYADWVISGSIWTARTLPNPVAWTSVTYGNGVFVAVAYGTSAATSPDGITWTARTLPSYANWNSVTYGNGVFVAVAYGSASAATSPDGITWTARTLPSPVNWISVAYGNGVFVAIVQSSNIAATSPDGINWTARTLPSVADWFSVTYGNGVYVAVAYNLSTVATSPNGITWTVRALGFFAGWCSIAYGNGVFVAVAYNSAIAATSPDGITWTARTLPTSANWRSVTYGNGVFVAVAYGSSKAANSPDGIIWTARTLPSLANWYSVIYGSGVFVAVASGSSAATSP